MAECEDPFFNNRKSQIKFFTKLLFFFGETVKALCFLNFSVKLHVCKDSNSSVKALQHNIV